MLFGFAASTPATISVVTVTPEVAFVAQETEPQTEPQTAPERGVEALVSDVAGEYDISSTSLYNLTWSESRLNPEAVGDKGCSFGLVQINLCVHDSVTEEQALDPEFALRYAARAIKDGKEDAWSVCNCYAYVSTRVKLPKMANIQPNSNADIGSVAIFYYPSGGKFVKHIAIVVKKDSNGFTVMESNKTHCLLGSRVVKWDDPRLDGFWKSP